MVKSLADLLMPNFLDFQHQIWIIHLQPWTQVWDIQLVFYKKKHFGLFFPPSLLNKQIPTFDEQCLRDFDLKHFMQ